MTNPVSGGVPEPEKAYQNTDRELWRAPPGDYYADSIHVTEGGGIGMNVGGYVVVMPIREWHKLAKGWVPEQGPDEFVTITCERCGAEHECVRAALERPRPALPAPEPPPVTNEMVAAFQAALREWMDATGNAKGVVPGVINATHILWKTVGAALPAAEHARPISDQPRCGDGDCPRCFPAEHAPPEPSEEAISAAERVARSDDGIVRGWREEMRLRLRAAYAVDFGGNL